MLVSLALCGITGTMPRTPPTTMLGIAKSLRARGSRACADVGDVNVPAGVITTLDGALNAALKDATILKRLAELSTIAATPALTPP